MHKTHVCKNCGKAAAGNFCPNCGQSYHEGKIDAHYFLHDIPHSVFHVDKGFFYTLLSLFTRPGGMIRDYLEGKRVKYFRPFAYVIIMSTICTLLVKLISAGIAGTYAKYHPGYVAEDKGGFFNHYFSVFIFLMIPIASVITFLFMRRGKYNFWEHFLINTYIAAQLNIMQVLVYLVGWVMMLVTHQFGKIDIGLYIPFFMTAFLFMYGSVFGFLMKDDYRKGWLVLRLTLMNCFLFFLYFSGFQLTGTMRPW
ncbi:DUF3667 domain-containing protein [Chitinophaga caseinilytica]|uniref:DUF3667 domain-containing protein n=1 Tax=Chitinophaga caseinilytica TaxID=2267521 RepID=A0ABZ2Z4I3_9BACT